VTIYSASIYRSRMTADADADADRVIDVDREKLSPNEALFWKICVFCEAHLGLQSKEDTNE
jgi:hypothetical protein